MSLNVSSEKNSKLFEDLRLLVTMSNFTLSMLLKTKVSVETDEDFYIPTHCLFLWVIITETENV